MGNFVVGKDERLPRHARSSRRSRENNVLRRSRFPNCARERQSRKGSVLMSEHIGNDGLDDVGLAVDDDDIVAPHEIRKVRV